MKPLTLRAANFRSYETIDLDFPEGCTAIVGPNGAGKSTLVMAADLALFGPESRSLAPYLSDEAVGDLMIELQFEHDGHLYRVRRGFSANGRGKASADFERFDPTYESGPDGGVPDRAQWDPLTRETIKETDLAIASVIGMTRDTYRASAYLAQGDGSFADPSWDPRQRKELLFKSLGLDAIWTPLLDRARADKRECEAQRQELTGRVGTLEETIAGKVPAEIRASAARLDAERADLDAQAAGQAVATAQAKVTEAEKDESRRREYAARLKTAEQTWQGIAEIDERATISQAQFDELKPMIAERIPLAAKKSAIAKHLAALEEERSTLAAKLSEAEAVARDRQERQNAIERREAEIAGLKAKAGAAENAAARVVSGEIETCHACGQTLPDEAATKLRETYLAEAAEAMSKAETLIAVNAADNAALSDSVAPVAALGTLRLRDTEIMVAISAARPAIEAAQAAEVSLATLTAQAKSYEEHVSKAQTPEHAEAKRDAEVELRAAQVELANVSGDAVDLDALKRSAESAAYSLNVAQTAARDAHTEVVKAEAELERIAKAEEQLAEHATERERLNVEHDLLCQLERAYGRDGIPALIVENSAIPAIEDEANRILGELHTDYRVELRTQRELKSGDGLADTLDVIILTDIGERPYESFSGGERSRINVALRIALARLLAHRRGAESRALLLDEVEYLDDEGLAALAEILRGLQSEFDLVLIVSHAAGLRDAFDQVIEIRKDGNRSEVVS